MEMLTSLRVHDACHAMCDVISCHVMSCNVMSYTYMHTGINILRRIKLMK